VSLVFVVSLVSLVFVVLKPYELPPASQGLVSAQAISPTNPTNFRK